MTTLRTLLCFGDSNTHGTLPMRSRDDARRLGRRERWPGVLQAALGPDWHVIEDGLPGRTIGRDDPVEGADRNALRTLPASLQAHRPLDVVVFLLGTNDLKARFGASAEQIAEGAHALIDTVLENTRPGAARVQVLLVCPPPIEEHGVLADMFSGGAAKARGLAAAMQAVAAQRGGAFLDAGAHIAVSTEEGIHLDAAAHARLGAVIAETVRSFALG